MKKMLLAAAAALMTATPALAADFPIFVSKGSVQSALGLNNNQLQAQADELVFTIDATNEWTCSRPHPTQDRDIVQERNSTISGTFSHAERVRNQITGFWLRGYTGDVTTDGPETGSCPANPSGFVYDDNLESSGGGILVNGVPL